MFLKEGGLLVSVRVKVGLLFNDGEKKKKKRRGEKRRKG